MIFELSDDMDVIDIWRFFKGNGLKSGSKNIHALTIMRYKFTNVISKVRICWTNYRVWKGNYAYTIQSEVSSSLRKEMMLLKFICLQTGIKTYQLCIAYAIYIWFN